MYTMYIYIYIYIYYICNIIVAPESGGVSRPNDDGVRQPSPTCRGRS